MMVAKSQKPFPRDMREATEVAEKAAAEAENAAACLKAFARLLRLMHDAGLSPQYATSDPNPSPTARIAYIKVPGGFLRARARWYSMSEEGVGVGVAGVSVTMEVALRDAISVTYTWVPRARCWYATEANINRDLLSRDMCKRMFGIIVRRERSDQDRHRHTVRFSGDGWGVIRRAIRLAAAHSRNGRG